jgi:FkbM family methyltransferase
MLLTIKKIIRNALIIITANKPCQDFLSYVISVCHFFMGIGPSGDVFHSGEQSIIIELKKYGRYPYCIIDAGANIGQFSSLILSVLDTNDKFIVHCFEPSTAAYAILYQKFQKNPHFVLNNIGLGKEKGIQNLFYDKPGSVLSCLTKREFNHHDISFHNSEKVNIDTLDNYCYSNRINRIDLLKMDVEGHELDVLSGAKNLFKNNSINMVSFEFGETNIDTRIFFKDLYYFLNLKNFSLYRITQSGYLYLLPSYKEEYEQFHVTNFLAVNNALL